MTQTDYGDKLWDKTIRCGSVISQNRLQSTYAEGLLPSIRAQVRNHLATHSRLSYDELVRYAQALGDSVRASRKSAPTVGFRKPEPHGKPQRRVLSVETDSVDTAVTQVEGDEAVLAFSAYTTPVVGSSASSTTSNGTSRFSTPYGPTPPSSAPSVQSASLGMVTPKRPHLPHGNPAGIYSIFCWFCLSQTHNPGQCPLIPAGVRDKMLEQRNTNFRLLAAKGLNPLTGKPRGPRPNDTSMVAMLGTEQGVSISAPTETEDTQTVSPQSGGTFFTARDQENI